MFFSWLTIKLCYENARLIIRFMNDTFFYNSSINPQLPAVAYMQRHVSVHNWNSYIYGNNVLRCTRHQNKPLVLLHIGCLLGSKDTGRKKHKHTNEKWIYTRVRIGGEEGSPRKDYRGHKNSWVNQCLMLRAGFSQWIFTTASREEHGCLISLSLALSLNARSLLLLRLLDPTAAGFLFVLSSFFFYSSRRVSLPIFFSSFSRIPNAFTKNTKYRCNNVLSGWTNRKTATTDLLYYIWGMPPSRYEESKKERWKCK